MSYDLQIVQKSRDAVRRENECEQRGNHVGKRDASQHEIIPSRLENDDTCIYRCTKCGRIYEANSR